MFVNIEFVNRTQIGNGEIGSMCLFTHFFLVRESNEERNCFKRTVHTEQMRHFYDCITKAFQSIWLEASNFIVSQSEIHTILPSERPFLERKKKVRNRFLCATYAQMSHQCHDVNRLKMTNLLSNRPTVLLCTMKTNQTNCSFSKGKSETAPKKMQTLSSKSQKDFEIQFSIHNRNEIKR